MRQRLTSLDLSIEELLSGRFAFSIPAYQRDYTWGRSEAEQLIDDIAAVFDDVERNGAETPYFLGTMLFVEAPGGFTGDDALPRQVEVVDGQQRLITLAILFAVLRDVVDDASEAAALDAMIAARTSDGTIRPHLHLRSADETFFQTAIQAPAATRRSRPAAELGQSLARRNIEEVRRALRARVARGMTDQARRELIAFIRSNTRVLVVSSDDFDYAYQIFLTINDRGKRLSVEDIFRGEILGPLDRNQRERYEAIIDEMDKYREEAEANRTKGKTFFSHLATIDGWPRRGIIDGLKKAVERKGGPRRFVAEVFAPMAESYLQIKSAPTARPPPPSVQPWLIRLGWLEQHGDDDWVPICMAALHRLAADETALTDLLRHLDRFAHVLMALGCGRDARRQHYAPILRRMLAPEPLPTAADLLPISPVNQKAALRNIATRLHYIDAPTAKLVLARVDEALTGRPPVYYAPLILKDRRDPDRFTVEHLCPKGDIAGGDWLRLFPRKPARIRASQCIGNLFLVTESQNRRGSQKDFQEKKRIFLDATDPPPFQLTAMLQDETEWDGLAISRRYALIMATVKDMWMLEGPLPDCPALAMAKPPPE